MCVCLKSTWLSVPLLAWSTESKHLCWQSSVNICAGSYERGAADVLAACAFSPVFLRHEVGFWTLTYIPKTKMHILLGPKGAGEQPAQGDTSTDETCTCSFYRSPTHRAVLWIEEMWSNSRSHILNGKREKNGFLWEFLIQKGSWWLVSLFTNNPPWWMFFYFFYFPRFMKFIGQTRLWNLQCHQFGCWACSWDQLTAASRKTSVASCLFRII